MSKDKKKKCNLKCKMCQHYERQKDFCKEKKIVDCSKQHTDFSQCNDYIINEKLIMY